MKVKKQQKQINSTFYFFISFNIVINPDIEINFVIEKKYKIRFKKGVCTGISIDQYPKKSRRIACHGVLAYKPRLICTKNDC